MDLALRVLSHRFQIIFDRIPLAFSVAIRTIKICKCITAVSTFKAGVKRCTSHEPNGMQMRKTLCSPSLAFDSAHVKYGV